MVHQGDEAQVEGRIDPFGDRVNLDARWLHCLRQTYHMVRNRFGLSQWYSYVTKLKWNIVSVRLEIVLNLTQDRCTVLC
jgi:hypothetical protein